MMVKNCEIVFTSIENATAHCNFQYSEFHASHASQRFVGFIAGKRSQQVIVFFSITKFHYYVVRTKCMKGIGSCALPVEQKQFHRSNACVGRQNEGISARICFMKRENVT